MNLEEGDVSFSYTEMAPTQGDLSEYGCSTDDTSPVSHSINAKTWRWYHLVDARTCWWCHLIDARLDDDAIRSMLGFDDDANRSMLRPDEE